MKKLLNKQGMTYVELLVAFTLLMFIIVSFTPMLLQSYDAIYRAGEKSQDLYNSKTELEQGLAVRTSADFEDFKISFDDYISETKIVGRRIPATTQAMMETLFYGAHSTLEIISPNHVPDDSDVFKVVLQATNIPVTMESVKNKTKDNVEAAAATATRDDDNVVAIIAKAPSKTASVSADGTKADTTSEEAAYDTNGVELKVDITSVDASTGKIMLTLSPTLGHYINFTTSPIRIQAYFINERGQMKQAFDYLYIDPMTILIGGDVAEGADYFTSPGVVAERQQNGAAATKTFNVEGRAMPRSNANAAYIANPIGNTSFRTIDWIDNDQNREIAPYYVMTGTGGYIYRMYNWTHNGSDYKNKAAQVGTNSLVATTDGFMSIKSGATVFPSYWSGDATDWFSFQTAYKSNTYGVDQSDNNFDCSFLTHYNTEKSSYTNRAHYSLVYSGYKTAYKYLAARGRRISYVQTEHGQQSVRLAGKLDEQSDYKGFNAPWENDRYWGQGTDGDSVGFLARRPYITEPKPAYFWTVTTVIGGIGTSWNPGTTDYHFAPVYLKSYTSIPPTALESVRSEFAGAFWCPYGSDADMWSGTNLGASPVDTYSYKDNTGQGKSETSVADSIRSTGTINTTTGEVKDEKWGIADWVTSKYAMNVDLTSVAYIPVSTGGSTSSGQLVYFGTVPSYGLIMQHDAKNNSSADLKTPQRVWNSPENMNMPGTAYYVDGSPENGANIYRYSGSSGKQTIHHDAYPGEEIPAQYANWIPAQQANWIPAQYANPIPAQYANWIYTTWVSTPDLLLVKAKRIYKLFDYELEFYSTSGSKYSIDTLRNQGYLDGDWFWFIDASTSTNQSSAITTYYDEYIHYLDPGVVGTHETPPTPINMDGFSYKHNADFETKDDFPSLLKNGKNNDTIWIYLIKNGSDHVTAGHWDRTDCNASTGLVNGTGAGYWDRTDVDPATGLINGTNCWDTTNCNSEGIINGTNCWDRTDCDPVTGLINGTGPGYYVPGKEPRDAYDEVLEDADEVDSMVVQNGIKNALNSRAAPNTSHNTDQLFYNTFRDKATYVYSPDLRFTFGYCSNWLIGTGTVVIQSAASMQSTSGEVAKSFEKFYTRSQPSAVQGASGTTNTGVSAQNNLKYDTWFPGEYYNLTKTATLDGVTVACGYAVAGAAFEAQPVKDNQGNGVVDDSGNLRYSTALGGIYNDGVLSIYDNAAPIASGTAVDGSNPSASVDGSFRNILYYKSNMGFDEVTHSRQSVRFTAIDIMSELNSSGSLEYYAYYGDNHGNLYRSKVAYTSGQATFDDEGNPTGAGTASLNLVQNISYSDMQMITTGGTDAFTNGYALSTVFSEIETITCSPNLIAVTGKTSDSTAKVVVLYRERTGVNSTTGVETYSNWKTRTVSLGTGIIHDAIILNGYYYAVGENGNVGKIWAVTTDSLQSGSLASVLPTVKIGTQGGTTLPKLYCIAGRVVGQSSADDYSTETA